MTGSSSSADAAFPSGLVALVEAYLRALRWSGAADLEPFDRALVHPLEAGGKRLRPVLLLATVEALGGDVEAALPTAAALEYAHTFSLVHDDLPALDDDDLRRGRPTTHVAFGEDVAILVGDALLNLAYRLVLERQAGPAERRLAVLGELSRALDGMIRGQYLDLRAAGEVDEASLRRVSGLKTGCLIQASVGCALALQGVDGADADAYRGLGEELGYGFQVVDDLLDATSSEAVLGKTPGADATRGKGHVAVLGLDRARAVAARSEERVGQLLDALPGEVGALRGLARRIYRRDR